MARLTKKNSALKKQLADARAANPGVGPAEEAAAGRLAREIKTQGGAHPYHSLTVEKNIAWRERDEARKANPVAITKKQRAVLLKAFHPDKENDTATPARKTQLNAAAAIFNALKFRVLDRD
jgi:hypothetical protein